jgi:hypothetical protein
MTGGCLKIWYEERLDISGCIGVPDTLGTADCIALMPDNELQVHDLKYGKGVRVYVEDNWQLILYALGAVKKAIAEKFDIDTVRLVIHQPRLGHVDEIVYTVEELEEFRVYAARAAQIAIELYNEDRELCDDDLNPGEKQCRFCPAKGGCKSLAEFSLKTVIDDLVEENPTEQIKAAVKDARTLSPERLGYVLGSLDLISQWIKAVESHAMDQVKAGVEIPGWKAVLGRAGNRKWTDENVVEEVFKSMRLKKEEMYKLKIISPTDAEKLLKDSARKWNRVKDLITRSEPAPTLAPESDKRPAVVFAAVEEFEDVTNNNDVSDLL